MYSHSGLRWPSYDSASLRCSTSSVVGSTSLCWLIHASAALRSSYYCSVGLVGLSRGSAVLCGFGWGSACLRPLNFVSFVPARPTPGSAVLRVSVLCRMVLRWPFRPNFRTLSNYLLFCTSLWFWLTLLSILGPPLALPMVVGPPRALTLFLRPRLACMLLRWPQLALLLLRIHPLVLGFLLQLWSRVRCRSLHGPQPVALRSVNVRRFDLSTFLIVFPTGFHLLTPGCMFVLRLYIAVRCLYRLFCPVRGDAVRSPMPRCHGVHVYVLHGEGCGLLLDVTALVLYVSFG